MERTVHDVDINRLRARLAHRRARQDAARKSMEAAHQRACHNGAHAAELLTATREWQHACTVTRAEGLRLHYTEAQIRDLRSGLSVDASFRSTSHWVQFVNSLPH